MFARIFTVATCVLWIAVDISQAKVHYKVKCSEDAMLIELVKTEDMTSIYLEQLKHYPDAACRPVVEGSKVSLSLSLRNIFECGVTRIANNLTGRRTYYHRMVVENADTAVSKEVLLVKCVLGSASNHSVSRRNVLPAGFQEPEDLEIIRSVVAEAPEPLLNVSVRQGGEKVTGELNVNPGTPLQMEIFLDKGSSPVYGLLVSYMQVTDTKSQEETIIFNGCSVDPYLFENFNTVDGDFLSAKFRAFKFPESTYVLFKGTVNVCLDKCRGVECSSGQMGYGRRRREINSMAVDSNKIFEVTMTTFIKVDLIDGILMEKGKLGGVVVVARNSPANETVKVIQATLEEERYQLMGKGEEDHHHHHHLKLAKEEITEEFEISLSNASIVSVPFIVLALLASLCYHF